MTKLENSNSMQKDNFWHKSFVKNNLTLRQPMKCFWSSNLQSRDVFHCICWKFVKLFAFKIEASAVSVCSSLGGLEQEHTMHHGNTHSDWKVMHKGILFNIPGVAGGILITHSLIHWVGHPFIQNLLDTFYPKQ